MAHKRKNNPEKQTLPYKIDDALKIADEIMKLGKEQKYNIGAFVHGMIFALEYAQFSYQIPQQQIAIIKRDCRKYFKHVDEAKNIKK